MTGRQDGIFDEGNVAAADFQRSRWPLPMAWLGSVDCSVFERWTVKWSFRTVNGEKCGFIVESEVMIAKLGCKSILYIPQKRGLSSN